MDTNILSVLYYRGKDLRVSYQAQSTKEWWERERGLFQLYTSVIAEDELAQGKYPNQKKALAQAQRLGYLQVNATVRRYHQLYLIEGLVPESKPEDAIHLALAVVHNMDYLLTWNHAHLANVQVQERLRLLNVREGYRAPFLVSPDTIPRAMYGKDVRRG
ncbi:MAG: type II toxin-antitoxin system VapC family toxin [Planctomycetota bacterium]|nr:type II toxin-antitoxin system VapC family toxin [Planctomycetota bacterium]